MPFITTLENNTIVEQKSFGLRLYLQPIPHAGAGPYSTKNLWTNSALKEAPDATLAMGKFFFFKSQSSVIIDLADMRLFKSGCQNVERLIRFHKISEALDSH